MKKITLFLCMTIAVVPAISQKLYQTDKDAIMQVFQAQEDAWNAGEIDTFMEGYWKSDELAFVGASGPTYGWQNTLDNYKKRYPNRTAMGKLKFEILKLRKIDKKTAFIIGTFHLTRTIGDLSGYFTLVWRKINGKWLIVSDHTSSEN